MREDEHDDDLATHEERHVVLEAAHGGDTVGAGGGERTNSLVPGAEDRVSLSLVLSTTEEPRLSMHGDAHDGDVRDGYGEKEGRGERL
ncbi:hypothetical protein DFH06DRAFT_1319316 [Mycena polygramma]|nr:hypothetical protein DFH06DRAFT_1319316 [Mycena polygramma]